MRKRDLLTNPCWRSSDLGLPLPESPHAVSVALPTWENIIAYEEKDPECINKLKAIYPRFGFNPLIAEIAKKAIELEGDKNCTAWPFPNFKVANKAAQHCKNYSNYGITTIKAINGLACLIADNLATPHAKAFWQHTGLGASSRLAAIALGEEENPSKIDAFDSEVTLLNRLAEIYECSEDFIQLHPSGMAAFYTALEVIREIHPNRPTLQLGFPYVDVLKLPRVIFEGSDLLLNINEKTLEEAIEKLNPAALVVEIPSNPMLKCIDLPSISKIAHKKGIAVIADDTIGSAININTLPYADLIFSSLTKSFAGRGDILAGSLVISPYSYWKEKFLDCRNNLRLSPLSNPDIIALENASRDISERLPKLNQACIKLKGQLEHHPEISNVLHPEECSNFRSLMRPGAGYGCLLSFELKEGLSKAKRVYNALEVCKGPSLGTNFTLVCPYVFLAHYEELEWAESCGVPSHLLRISVGLENHQDLWNRFKKALSA